MWCFLLSCTLALCHPMNLSQAFSVSIFLIFWLQTILKSNLKDALSVKQNHESPFPLWTVSPSAVLTTPVTSHRHSSSVPLPTICTWNHPVCKEIKGDSWVSCSLSMHLLGVQRRFYGKIRYLEIKAGVGQAVHCSLSGAELLAQRVDHSFWSLAQVMVSGDSSKALKAPRKDYQRSCVLVIPV